MFDSSGSVDVSPLRDLAGSDRFPIGLRSSLRIFARRLPEILRKSGEARGIPGGSGGMPNHGTLWSRRHARVLAHDGQVTLEDLGRKDGTRAGDETVTVPVSLIDGDVIHVGRIEIVDRVSTDPLSTLVR